jgi:hypothetical protein
MLADTLSNPLFAGFGYSDEEPTRPATSPQPPRTPTRSSGTRRPPVPPLPVGNRLLDQVATPSPPPATAVMSAPDQNRASQGNGNGNGNGTSQPQPYTFRSLYEMLSDERSARRRLETQMRGMRQEITDLQYQVSVGSHVQSQRSSVVPMDPMLGSSRLRELLRGTESSPPGTSEGIQHPLGFQQIGQAQHQQARDSNTTGFTSSTGNQAGMVSRFSGSDSEVGAAPEESTDDLTTPYEAYQTPREERARFPFSEHRQSVESEGDMF